MKINALLIVTMFLASAMILPVGLSYETYGGTMQPSSGNQAGMNQTMTTNSTGMNSTMKMSMNGTQTNMTATSHHSSSQSALLHPLQQFKSGVAVKSVSCQSGYSLVIKAEDGSPACVHASTVQILILRGWATPQ
ncbi:MAG: hypothetical protein ACREAT_02610 [Nitrosotalea sp.]